MIGKVAVGAVLGAAICCAPAANAATPQRTPAGGEALYVHTAEHGTLRPVKVKGKRAFRLTLGQPAARVHGIVGSAEREFDFQSTAGFVKSWSAHGFTRNAPNAAIVRPNASHKRDVLIAKLSQPRLLSNGNVSYLARPVESGKPADLRYFNNRADRHLPVSLGATSVFLDDPVDSRLPFNVNFNAVGAAVGFFTWSAPEVFNISSSLGTVYTSSETGFQLVLATGNVGRVSGIANPLGDCMHVTFSSDGTGDGTFTGQAANGPERQLKEGPNELPLVAGARCGAG
jgi:hypothetical protein